MKGRCADCKIKEKLRNLQVLCHIMRAREKERCAAHDEGSDLKKRPPENNAGEATIRRR